jgi:hypothetical protein
MRTQKLSSLPPQALKLQFSFANSTFLHSIPPKSHHELTNRKKLSKKRIDKRSLQHHKSSGNLKSISIRIHTAQKPLCYTYFMMQQKTSAAVAIVNFVIKSVHDLREKCVFNDFLEKNNKALALRLAEKGKTQENLQIW